MATTIRQPGSVAAAHLVWPFSVFPDWERLDMFGGVPAAGAEVFRVEEFLAGDELVIRAELPGIDPQKDVDVTISRGALHIDVRREDGSAKSDRSGFRTEFHYGEYSRSIPLPAGTYETEVKATYNDGILDVRLPVARTVKRKIDVTRR
jgi:HSP20 family protein